MELEYLTTGGIIAESLSRFIPVWIALAVTLVGGWFVRDRLSTFGRLYGSPVGLAGITLVLFWVFTALFADMIAVLEAREVAFLMKKAQPGGIDPQSGIAFLWGGDNLGRDVFSRVVYGSRVVLIIAPAATLIAYMVGITLGLPAGYNGGWIDSVLSFVANLVLAFPVILLFYLLVTPEIRALQYDTWLLGWMGVGWSIPRAMAAFFFLFPILFLTIMWFTKYEKNRTRLLTYGGITALVGFWIYFGIAFGWEPKIGEIPLNLALDPNELNVFAAVVFASSPGVFRIVRGLTMDIKTRDYVAAAQTRGERPWYIMLWEILPNARGPLIVDACLRIGYTTILLGTLGFFGLGLEPESPDWGSMINHGRQFVRLASTAHMALFPALALMLLVLGLNLMADGLREESLKD
ncbi:ABC transporter permease [Paralimibaculum aggregatum]|uniref:ABC transporter permease n=1 Tax=Paralimibaculum aggregatum TaxID=3036245 RepID=A0ABQ6LDE0_9RHOB|nr:ABC transporter permease [Limibaculum sp. NKW23]GMG81375.1 ABC transporter permease [Limibaculum sp. NKW23]